jgi:hypothetical protein
MTSNESAVQNFIAKNGRPPEMKNEADQDAIWFLIRDEHRARGESFPSWCWKYEVKSAIVGYWKTARLANKACNSSAT